MDPQRRRLTVSVGASGDGEGSTQLPADALKSVCQELSANGDEVFVVHSQTDRERKDKRTFAEKEKFGVENEELLNSYDVFFTCRKGKKPEAANQDSYVTVINKGKWSLFGVFDGHGPNGHDVSDFSIKALCKIFFAQDYIGNTEEAFKVAFNSCQEALFAINKEKKRPFDPTASGCTCTMAFHNLESDELILAHAGDSRGVLYHGGSVNHSTLDHKPNLPEERKRIEAAGGRVVFDGYYNYRVFAKAGSYPGLNMSRALGDTRAHDEAGLTAEPDLKRIDLKKLRATNPDLTLLICTDGVWEFIEDPQAFTHFKKDNSKLVQGQKAVNDLAQDSFEKWMQDSENEISDDITVLVANLSGAPPS